MREYTARDSSEEGREDEHKHLLPCRVDTRGFSGDLRVADRLHGASMRREQIVAHENDAHDCKHEDDLQIREFRDAAQATGTTQEARDTDDRSNEFAGR